MGLSMKVIEYLADKYADELCDECEGSGYYYEWWDGEEHLILCGSCVVTYLTYIEQYFDSPYYPWEHPWTMYLYRKRVKNMDTKKELPWEPPF